MNPQDPNMYQSLNELIKKHIAIFGSDITFTQLHEIKGLEIDADGTILKISGDQKEVEKEIMSTWTTLSPFLAKKIIEN